MSHRTARAEILELIRRGEQLLQEGQVALATGTLDAVYLELIRAQGAKIERDLAYLRRRLATLETTHATTH